jgi:hypothetical protein
MIERAPCLLRQYSAVAARYDKRDYVGRGTIDAVSAWIWLRHPSRDDLRDTLWSLRSGRFCSPGGRMGSERGAVSGHVLVHGGLAGRSANCVGYAPNSRLKSRHVFAHTARRSARSASPRAPK